MNPPVKPLVMSRKYLVAAAFMALLATPAQAVVVIDQNQPIVGDGSGFGTLLGVPGQTFQQTANNVAGVGVFIVDLASAFPHPVTVSLYDGIDAFGGVLLASGSGLVTLNGFFDVFWEPVPVVPNTTLFLRVFSSSSSPDLFWAGDEVFDGGPYANGTAVTAGGGLFLHRDYTFRTYAENGLGGGQDVPEPATLMLLGAGLAGIGAVRRQRK